MCRWCFAAAAHILMWPSQPGNNVHVFGLKESMAAAMKLYKQPAGAEVEDVLSSLDVEAGGYMAFASIGTDAGNRTRHKKEHVGCWLAAFSHDAAGNV